MRFQVLPWWQFEVVTFIMTLRSLVCGHEHFIGICYHQLNCRGGKFLQNTGKHVWFCGAWLLKNHSSYRHAVSYLRYSNAIQECISIVQMPSPVFWPMLPSGVLISIFRIWQYIRKISVTFFLEFCMCTECGIEQRYPNSKRQLFVRGKERQFCMIFYPACLLDTIIIYYCVLLSCYSVHSEILLHVVKAFIVELELKAFILVLERREY